jgi:hypothetical protein
LSEDSALSTKPDLEEVSKLSDDPELRKRRRQQDKNAPSRNRYATDLTRREWNLALQSIWKRNRYTTDQDYRNHVLEKSRKDYAMKMDTIPQYAITMALRYWVYHSPVAREQLSWKTHIPILTSEKVERHCATCRVKRRGGTKLFWQRRQKPAGDEYLFDCNGCFFKDPVTFLPEGFEDVKTAEQLRIRGEQLLGIKTRPWSWRTASPPPSTRGCHADGRLPNTLEVKRHILHRSASDHLKS